MSKFSVLMPIYYKERPDFFDKSLESNLQRQTLRPDEFVLICDGKLTQELEAVIEKYQNLFPDIMKVYRKENGGLGKALNFGLPKCSYSFVARSDSDDVCDEHRFEKQVKFMNEHPEIGIISSYIDEFETDWKNPKDVKKLPLTSDELFQWAKSRNPLNHMAVMMRKEDILRIGSYRHMPFAEDYDLWVRALADGIKLGNVGEVLVHARVCGNTINRRGDRRLIHSYYVLNKYMKDHDMISTFTCYRNIAIMSSFVFMPLWMKKLVYKGILRK